MLLRVWSCESHSLLNMLADRIPIPANSAEYILSGTMGTVIQPLIVIVGPTASGKSSLAIDVGAKLIRDSRPAEIINADSMLVYRGMDIGTAKPTASERAQIRHHLVDIKDVTETAGVAEFQTLARAAIADCRCRGVVPILVGGSALYIRAIIDHFEFPGTDPDVRARWQAECDRIGPHALYQVLKEVSPEAAAHIEPGNGRRIVRALEVVELTGSFTATLPKWEYALDNVHQFGLSLDRETMDQRIAARVEAMWAQGLVDEVRRLAKQGLENGLTASRGLGYRQVLEFLHGDISEDEAKEATIVGTRKFSRKQLMWFKRDHRITQLPAGDSGNVDAIISQVFAGTALASGVPTDSLSV